MSPFSVLYTIQPGNSFLTNPYIQTLLGEEEYNKVLGEINADLKEEEKVRSSFLVTIVSTFLTSVICLGSVNCYN